MLTNTEVKNLKIKQKVYYVKDSHGLRLQINPCGSKIWQHRFRIEGKQKIRNGGEYPETSLQEARQWRDENKRLIKRGIIPPKVYNSTTNDNQDKNTFKDLFDMWYANQKDSWSYDYAIDTQQRVEKHLLPLLGYKPITEINTKTMRDLLLDIQDKGLIDTLYKVKSIASRIFNYSIGMEISEINPVNNLSNDIFKKNKINLAVNQKYFPTSLNKIQKLNVEFSASFGRQLEYYTGMVFKIDINSKSKNINIINGGRYDKLISDLGSKKQVPAVGAALNLNS